MVIKFQSSELFHYQSINMTKIKIFTINDSYLKKIKRCDYICQVYIYIFYFHSLQLSLHVKCI